MLVIVTGCKSKLLLNNVSGYIFTVRLSGVYVTESAGAGALDQMDGCSQQKPSSDESDGQHDGEMQRKRVSLFEPTK